MTIETQGIAPLAAAVQQHNREPLAAVKADQAITLEASGVMDLERTRHLADTSAGSVVITLAPLAQWPRFMAYAFQKVDAANTMTIAAAAGETIEGAASVAVTGEHEVVTLYSDGAVLRRFSAGGSAAPPAGVLLASADLSDVASAATALTNLGGTSVGVDVFTAASAGDARTALGSTAVGDDVFTAATASDARIAIGVSVLGDSLVTAVDAAAFYTALGLGDHVDDAAAAIAGVAVGVCYHTAGVLKTRMV